MTPEKVPSATALILPRPSTPRSATDNVQSRGDLSQYSPLAGPWLETGDLFYEGAAEGGTRPDPPTPPRPPRGAARAPRLQPFSRSLDRRREEVSCTFFFSRVYRGEPDVGKL